MPLILILFKLLCAELVFDGLALDIIKHPLFFKFVNLLQLKVFTLVLIVVELHCDESLFVYEHAVFHLGQRKLFLVLCFLLQG